MSKLIVKLKDDVDGVEAGTRGFVDGYIAIPNTFSSNMTPSVWAVVGCKPKSGAMRLVQVPIELLEIDG